jgi:hypothetical protein
MLKFVLIEAVLALNGGVSVGNAFQVEEVFDYKISKEYVTSFEMSSLRGSGRVQERVTV